MCRNTTQPSHNTATAPTTRHGTIAGAQHGAQRRGSVGALGAGALGARALGAWALGLRHSRLACDRVGQPGHYTALGWPRHGHAHGAWEGPVHASWASLGA